MMYDPDLLARYMDLDLTYLPRGSASRAARRAARALYTSSKPVRVVSMSELNVADLKSNHVVYIGYISALDKLEDFVFASSSPRDRLHLRRAAQHGDRRALHERGRHAGESIATTETTASSRRFPARAAISS